MKTSATFCVALALLCISTLAESYRAQPLAQQDLRALREYLLTREETPQQPEALDEQEGVADELADTQLADTQQDIQQQQTSDQVVDERSIDNGESYFLQEERSWKENSSTGNTDGARDKSAANKPSEKRKDFYKLQVVKAEKYRYGGNGLFYTEVGVVVTVEGGSRLLIRRTKPNSSVRCQRKNCDLVSVIDADYMTSNWELVATKEPTKSTVGDYIKVSRSSTTRKAAADAMMKLD